MQYEIFVEQPENKKYENSSLKKDCNFSAIYGKIGKIKDFSLNKKGAYLDRIIARIDGKVDDIWSSEKDTGNHFRQD